MSKRGATGEQGSRDDPGSAFSNNQDMPQRADASILAGRKILAGKRRRTPGSPGLSNSSDALGNIFGDSTSSTMNGPASPTTFGSGFGQQQSASNFGVSHSFPPAANHSTFGGPGFGTTSNTQNLFGAGQGNSKPAFGSIPSTSFSFAGTSTNIFGKPQAVANKPSIFSGSTFGQAANNNANPVFGTFGQAGDANTNSDSDMQISPEVTPAKNTAQRSSIFDGNMNPSGAASNANIFGQQGSNNTSSQPSPNPFSSKLASEGQKSAPLFSFGGQSQGPSKPSDSPKAPTFSFSAGGVTPKSATGSSQPFTFGATSTPQAPTSSQFSVASTNIAASTPQISGTASPFSFNTGPRPAAIPSVPPPSVSSNPDYKVTNWGTASILKHSGSTDIATTPSLASPPASVAVSSPSNGSASNPTSATPISGSLFGNATTPAARSTAPIVATKQSNSMPPTLSDARDAMDKAYHEIRSLNEGYRKMLATMNVNMDWTNLMRAYISQYESIQRASETTKMQESTKRGATDELSRGSGKRRKSVESPRTAAAVSSKEKSQTVNIFQSILEKGSKDRPSSSSTPLSAPKVSGNGDVLNAAISTPKPAATAANSFASIKVPAAQQNHASTPQAAFNPFATLKTPSNVLSQPLSTTTSDPSVVRATAMITAAVPTTAVPTAVLTSVPSAVPTAVPTAAIPTATPSFTFKPSLLTAPNATPSPFNVGSTTPSATSSNVFSVKPPAIGVVPPVTTVPTFKPPVFGGGAPVNFMAQFGKAADKEAAKEKAKRKAEDFDSDEDDEIEWEKKYAEEQKEKKAKLAEAAKAKVAKFVPGKGFVIEEAHEDSSTPPAAAQPAKAAESAVKFTAPVSSSSSVFSIKPSQSQAPTSNIFGSLATQGTGKTSDDEDDQDDETAVSAVKSQAASVPEQDSDDDTLEDVIRKRNGTNTASGNTSTSGGSLFDRITPAVKRENENNAPTTLNNPFGFPATATTPFKFGQTNSTPGSNLFGNNTSPASDHTWKMDSPIKFGTNTGPTFNIEAATPAKPSLFTANDSTTPAGKPPSLFFGNVKSDSATSSLFGQTSTAPSSTLGNQAGGFGFNFGGPPKPDHLLTSPSLFSAATSKPSSNTTSRATSPGADSTAVASANDTSAEAEGDAEKPLAQTDLTSLSEAEKRDEDILFEVPKALCKQFVKSTAADAAGSWENKGTGPLRIFKNKQTGVARILMRAAPSGRIVINSRVLKDTENTQKSPKLILFVALSAEGKPQTWTAQVGKSEDAAKFKSVLDDNKPS